MTLAKNAQKEFLIGQSSRSHVTYRRPSLDGFYFICRGCLNPVTRTRCTSAAIGASAYLMLVDKFCYLGRVWVEVLMQLWRPEFELD